VSLQIALVADAHLTGQVMNEEAIMNRGKSLQFQAGRQTPTASYRKGKNLNPM
jgi:hypothetical protein